MLMKVNVAGALVFLLALSLQACGPDSENLGSVKSVLEPHGVWNKKVLDVCFLSSDPSQNIVQDVVKSEFARADFVFQGFGKCSSKSPSDVVVKVVPTGSKVSFAETWIYDGKRLTRKTGLGNSIGYDSPKGGFGYGPLPKGYRSEVQVELGTGDYCSATKIDFESCVKGLALHEFGHVLALRHEHARPEAAFDANCKVARSVDLADKETLGETAESKTRAYDPNSIMNYCFMDAYESGRKQLGPNGPELSQGDVETLLASHR